MLADFRGKLALVTGGAQGIGRETCLALAEWGADFISADVVYEGADAVAKEGIARGVKAEGRLLDVSHIEGINSFVNDLVDRYGKLDILVNCAGIAPTTALLDIDEAHWERVFSVNLKGTFFISQAVLSHMIETKTAGCIVNVASIAGDIGGKATSADYSITKGAIITLTKVLARYSGPHGIRVNAVSPGLVDTAMTIDWPREVKEEQLKNIPLQRMAGPREIATAIRFLASEQASFINGQTIRVNGGAYM